MKEYIQVNIGGKIFGTYKSVLMKSLFFERLFEFNDNPDKDDKGNIFIDRSPKYFEYILNYLRGTKDNILENDIQGLEDEAKYYCIDCKFIQYYNDEIITFENFTKHLKKYEYNGIMIHLCSWQLYLKKKNGHLWRIKQNLRLKAKYLILMLNQSIPICIYIKINNINIIWMVKLS